MSRDPKSPLLKKRALDALLDTMADGLDGHDNYDELGAHRRGESTPEQKGTEFDSLEGTGFMPSAVIIPPKDLTPPSSPDDAEFFKESEPKIGSEVYRSSAPQDLGLQSMEDLIKEVQDDSDDWKAKEAAGDPVATSNPQSLKNIKTEIAEIKDQVTQHLYGIAEELGVEDFSVNDILFTGSRLTGNIHDESDLDVVVFYEGDMREDDLFNSANDPNLQVDGINVDINPVQVGRRGELEAAGMVEKTSGIEEEIEGHEFYKQAPDEATFAAVADKLGIKYRGMLNDVPSYRLIHFTDPTTGTGIDVPLDEFSEEKVKEHLNAARERFGKPKIAGKNVLDSGDYDFKHEAHVREEMKTWAQYAERGDNTVAIKPFDPKGQYLCGTCDMRRGSNKCSRVEGDISFEKGSCKLYHLGEPEDDAPMKHPFSKADVKYGEHAGGFGCARCEYGAEATSPDPDGRTGWCSFWGTHVDTKACCAEWDQDDKKDKAEQEKLEMENKKVDNVRKEAAKGKTLYHVTNTDKVAKIKAEGILPLQTSNWVKGPEGERYGEGEIFAMDNANDAVRWAAKMDWEFNQSMGTGKISIISFMPGKEKWKADVADPLSQAGNKGKWLKAIGKIPAEQIINATVLTPDLVKKVTQGGEVKLAEEKTADVPTKSYGMGTPIGGTDNPDAGAEDDPVEGLAGEDSMDMTSSLEDDTDYDAENARIYAMLDEEDDRAERVHTIAAKRVDNAPYAVAAYKIASTQDVGWFAKSARPTEQKLELLQKQFKVTPEQMELCIAVDPSPNQSDFVAWIVKQYAKGAFQLPEDTEKMKGQLEKFQKFKKSPNFTFSKDIQQYDAPKLFETLQTAEATGLGSKKEQKRDVVSKGAEIVVQEGDIKIYKVTEPKAAMELGGGTNWCTAPPGNTMAATYLKDGPLYIFFDAGSAVAQLHCESNQFMNRQDVCILENVTGDAEYGRDLKKFLSDPSMLKALQLLAAKEVKVATWVQDNIADPGEVSKILGEAATEEIAYNVGFEKEIEEYEEEMAGYQKKVEEWEKKMKRLQPKLDKYNQDYDAYRAKMDEYYKTDHTTERPQSPDRPQTPDKPYPPRDPRAEPSYGYSRYNSNPTVRSKKFTMQVRSALASGVPLSPEIEQQLVGLNTQLLIKYGALFHPGQPWEPLAQTILKKVGEKGKVDKEAVDYAAKFVKGRWEPLEPYLLNKLFLVTNNMENMRTCLDYAIRAYKQRWPEFEDKIAKAKPGGASGYGAAQYAIRVLRKPWSAFPDIKRKKNGKINAEECMIIGNPGEARLYAEAFNSGKSWDAFEESALVANNLVALINYAEGQNRRMPALEEKILSGEQDTQENKGRRQRWRDKTDLPLEYSLKVIKGRWPEYEQKILDSAKDTKKAVGHGSGEYKPSHGEYGSRNRLDKRIVSYIEKVIQGRWPELEQILLARYQQQPEIWATNQNLVDGYLVTINDACQERLKDNSEVEEPEDNVPSAEEQQGTYEWNRKKRKDPRRQKPYTKFQQDPQCYWPEGESRLITRDTGYETFLVNELRERATPKSEADHNSYTKEEKYVSIEDLAGMERPGESLSYEEKEKKPSYTIWNGIWIGWYGMDDVEKYLDYMLSNGQTWKEGIDIMEIAEDLEDVRGRWNHSPRPQRRQMELGEPKSSAERFQQRFSSILLQKKALIDIEPAPSMLPPRDDLKGHMDEQMHDQLTKEVMKGVREPLNPKKKNRRPQIDPRINPDGVVASTDGKSEIRIRFKDKEEVFPVAPQDVMKAVRHAENLSMANPGFPVVFVLEEEGITSEDTYINGNHVGETVEKSAAEESDWKMMGKTGPHYYINTMDPNMVRAFHGKRFADAVLAGNKVIVWRAGKPDETLKPGTFLTANKRVAEGWLTPNVTSFGGPKLYRYEVDPADLVNVENMEASELVYKPRTKTAEYTDQDAQDDETMQLWLDQVQESEDDAKRRFMEEDYLKQIAQDDGVSMEELWNDMGEEYTAEYYGYPYKRVPDFTDESTKGLEEKDEHEELRLSGS